MKPSGTGPSSISLIDTQSGSTNQREGKYVSNTHTARTLAHTHNTRARVSTIDDRRGEQGLEVAAAEEGRRPLMQLRRHHLEEADGHIAVEERQPLQQKLARRRHALPARPNTRISQRESLLEGQKVGEGRCV